MKRRSFIKSSSLLSAPFFMGGIPVAAFKNNKLSTLVNGESDKILILIQLNGGNDGLNTVIPLDQESGLSFVRPQIYIPNDKTIKVSDTLGFHPSFGGLKSLYDNAELKVIQSVAYPDQNRSHFRSMDIWNTGSAADQYLDTGWIGRYLDKQFANYPEDYPNNECQDPFALTIGSVVSETCQGINGNFSLTISNPENLSQLNVPIDNQNISGCGAKNLDFLFKSIEQTNEYSLVIQDKYEQGNNMSDKYDLNDSLALKMKTIARLIAGGLQSKIYVVSLGGFDTHAFQAEDGDTVTGEHASLLLSLSNAIEAFQDDISKLGLADRVLGMTYSEFGRRIKGNFSFGTDHGTAGPLFVFGSCVNPGITGDNPVIDRDVASNEGVPMQFDFRSVYGSILMDWFEIDELEVKDLFAHDFQYIPIANKCTTTSTNEEKGLSFSLSTFPNPFETYCHISFESKGEWTKISVFDALGSEVKVLTNQKISKGKHQMTLDSNQLSSGVYFIRLQTRDSQKTIRVIKA